MPLFPPHQRPMWTPPAYLRGAATATSDQTIDVAPTSVEIHPAKTDLEAIPIVQHSHINLADFVKHKVTPVAPLSLPYVESMHWHFDEPRDENDHELRLYLVLSLEERTLIKRWGLQHHAFEQENLFDDAALDALQSAQNAELDGTTDPQLRASLAIEHKQQLSMAREAKIDITVEDYLAYPYVKQFENRYQATNAQRKLTGTIKKLQQMLEEYRAR